MYRGSDLSCNRMSGGGTQRRAPRQVRVKGPLINVDVDQARGAPGGCVSKKSRNGSVATQIRVALGLGKARHISHLRSDFCNLQGDSCCALQRLPDPLPTLADGSGKRIGVEDSLIRARVLVGQRGGTAAQ